MDTNGMTFDKQLNEMQLTLANTLINAVQKGKITEYESKEIADYILFQSDYVKNADQINILLQDLATKWSIFADLIRKENEKKQTIQQNDDNIAQVRNQFKELLHTIKS